MIRKVMIILVMALTMTQTAFAHVHRDYYDPMVIVTMIGISVGGTMLFWAILARNKGWSAREEMTMILMAMTAFVHLYIGIDSETLLLLNGAGYLVLMLLLYLPIEQIAPYRRYLLMITFGYTLVTFVGYYALHGVNLGLLWDWTGVFTKLMEAGLMALLGQTIMSQQSSAISAD